VIVLSGLETPTGTATNRGTEDVFRVAANRLYRWFSLFD
jgi:hypothetical protein